MLVPNNPFGLTLKVANSLKGNPGSYQLIAVRACKACGARGALVAMRKNDVYNCNFFTTGFYTGHY